MIDQGYILNMIDLFEGLIMGRKANQSDNYGSYLKGILGVEEKDKNNVVIILQFLYLGNAAE